MSASTHEKYFNFLGLAPEFSNYTVAQIALLPIAFDLTSTWQKGADRGPHALISASTNLELYDIETQSEIYQDGIYTAPEISGSSCEEMLERSYQEVKKFLKDDKFVVCIGGEHSVSYAPIKAHVECFGEISILQLDAHTDMRDSYEGNKYNHACVMARAKELVSNIVAVGIRSLDSAELLRINPAKIFYAEKIRESQDWIEQVISNLGKNVYITLDLDVFDPSIMPSTGTPEPGGLYWYEVLSLLKQVSRQRNLIGFDVVELCPNAYNRAPDFMAAKLVYKMLSYKFAK